jgi:hypothetical protein
MASDQLWSSKSLVIERTIHHSETDVHTHLKKKWKGEELQFIYFKQVLIAPYEGPGDCFSWDANDAEDKYMWPKVQLPLRREMLLKTTQSSKYFTQPSSVRLIIASQIS